MDDGKNYLVDVTNCDEGSSGSSDKLFLKSATEITKGKAYKCNNITYTYDNDQVGLYSPGGDELVLSNTDYVPRTLTKIEVTTQPTKTAYTVGETFDPAGMVVSAVYNRREGSPDETEALKSTDYTLSNNENLAAGTQTITITYKEKIATVDVTVTAAKTALTKEDFEIFSASFTYNGTKQVPEITLPDGLGGTAVTVTYCEKGKTATVEPTDAGEYDIHVKVAENEKYETVEDLNIGSFTISKANIDLDKTSVEIVAGENATITLRGVAAGKTVTYTSSNESVVTVANGMLTGVAKGTAIVTVGGNDNFSDATVTVNVSENTKKKVTVTFTADPASVEYKAGGYTLNEIFQKAAEATGVLAEEFTYAYGSETGLTWEELLAKKAENVGEYTVTASFSSDTKYGSQSATFEITKADQASLIITGGSTVAYGETLELGTTGGSFDGAVTWEVTSGGEYADISSAGVLTPKKAGGSVTVTAKMAGNDNYNEVTATAEITTTKGTWANKTGESSARFGSTGSFNITTSMAPEGSSFVVASLGENSIFESKPTVTGNTLSYKLKADATIGYCNHCEQR